MNSNLTLTASFKTAEGGGGEDNEPLT